MTSRFADFEPPATEAGKAYPLRLATGFLDRFCGGETVLDVGFTGYSNPDNKPSLPGAIGVDINYPGYDGLHLPWADQTVDCVFSSHCLEHIEFHQEVIMDWYRVLKIGGYIVCIVPSRELYEKKKFPPSRFSRFAHKRFYTPAGLVREFEEVLTSNSYRVRHLNENDHAFDYSIEPELHSAGCYEIEIVIQKISKPTWTIE